MDGWIKSLVYSGRFRQVKLNQLCPFTVTLSVCDLSTYNSLWAVFEENLISCYIFFSHVMKVGLIGSLVDSSCKYPAKICQLLHFKPPLHD